METNLELLPQMLLAKVLHLEYIYFFLLDAFVRVGVDSYFPAHWPGYYYKWEGNNIAWTAGSACNLLHICSFHGGLWAGVAALLSTGRNIFLSFLLSTFNLFIDATFTPASATCVQVTKKNARICVFRAMQVCKSVFRLYVRNTATEQPLKVKPIRVSNLVMTYGWRPF